MADSEYITNIRTIKLKIKMLIHTFFTHPLAIQQKSRQKKSGEKKIYSAKLNMFLFHSSKIEGLN